MRCKKEEFVKGAIFHIYNHSVNEIDLFYERSDYIYEVFNRFIVSYALHFNHKYKRMGKLFANKLQHKKINDERYLAEICPYIHLNPKRAGLVKKLNKWGFSNYPEWIGKREGVLFDNELLNEIFGNSSNYIDYLKRFDNHKIKEYLYTPSKTGVSHEA